MSIEQIEQIENYNVEELKLKMSAYKHFDVDLNVLKTIIACFNVINKLELANFNIIAAS